MIKGIVFDKDGTLLDYESFWVGVAENAVRILCEKYKISEIIGEKMLSASGAYDGISGTLCHGTYSDIAECFNRALTENGCDRTVTPKETAEAFGESLGCGRLVPTCENIAEVFEKLKVMGIKTALVTSDNEKLTKVCLSELGIDRYFDRLYTDDGINPSKPDPYYMKKFLNEFSLEASEVLMVGDTLTDMTFAKNSGVRGVGVAKNDKDRAILLTLTDCVVHDISNIFEVIDNGEN